MTMRFIRVLLFATIPLTLSCQSVHSNTPPSGNPVNPNPVNPSPVNPSPSNPNTINAASCSRDDVSAALSSIVADNTTVNIPAGACTWSTGLVYTQTNSFTWQGAGAQSAGPYGVNATTGSDVTIIYDNIDHSVGDPGVVKITTIAGKSLRITGTAFLNAPGNTSHGFNGIVRISGPSTSVRLDHNHFNSSNAPNWSNLDVRFSDVLGVFDHNFVEFHKNSIGIFDPNWQSPTCTGSCTNGHGSWNDLSYWGSSQAMFLEDNTISGLAPLITHFNDCSEGGRYVIRHNTMLHGAATQQHNGAGGNEGCRASEEYQNYAVNDSTPTGAFLYGRAGGSLVWGNTISGYFAVEGAYNDRSSSGQVDHSGPAPNGFGMAAGLTPHVGTVTVSGNTITQASGDTFDTNWIPGTVMIVVDGSTNQWVQINAVTSATSATILTGSGESVTCAASPCDYYVGSPWDGNTDYYGYPTINQMGRGKGDLLSGGFPDMINTTTGTQSYTHEALDPIYVWDNKLSSANTYWATGAIYNFVSKLIQENRDYYLELPNQDEPSGVNCAGQSACTAGIGQGTLAQRPANCMTGVGYWETDYNQLDKCSTTNTWSTQNCATGVDANGACFYQPYIYPHPLDH